MFPLLLILLSVVSSFSQNIPDCPGGSVEFNAPNDITQYTWYPYNFTGTLPPVFPQQYNCNYKINVLPGWSAALVLTVNTTVFGSDGAVSVIVVDSLKNSENVVSVDQEHFFFIANGGQIVLGTRRSTTNFGFAVKWWPNNKFTPTRNNVTIGATQPTVYFAYSTDPIVISAETKVSLVMTPPIDDNLQQNLRSVYIYDGPDWNSTCLGTARQLIASKKQIVSSGKYLTVALLRPYFSLGRTMLIFQDYENTKDIVEYQGIACPFVANCGQFKMDSSKGTAAISTVNTGSYSGAEYITSMTGSGTLDVYIGGKSQSKSNLIYSYPVADSAKYLPQEFLAYVRTYVLTGGNSATLNMTQTSTSFTKNAVVGRKGFMASRYYKSGDISPYQDIYDYISTSSGFSRTVVNFSFNIREVDFVGNTTLSIQVRNNGKNSYNQVFTSSNKPNVNTQIQALGDDFSVDYKTYNQQTKGFYLDFEIMKSSSQMSIFGVFFVIFLNFL